MNRILLALLTGAAFLAAAAAPVAASPPSGKYCTPLAFRDQVVGISYKAIVRAAPGCTKPALLRKENALTGSVIGEPWLIPLGKTEDVWLFTHRLRYTLDGKTWQRVVIR